MASKTPSDYVNNITTRYDQAGRDAALKLLYEWTKTDCISHNTFAQCFNAIEYLDSQDDMRRFG